MLFFSHFGAIWAPPNAPKKVLEGQQVGGMYGTMSELKNKPLTTLLGPFLSKKQGFLLFFTFRGHIGTLKWTPKDTSKVRK
jgi:hypothetical protein